MNRRKLLQILTGLVPAVTLAPHLKGQVKEQVNPTEKSVFEGESYDFTFRSSHIQFASAGRVLLKWGVYTPLIAREIVPSKGGLHIYFEPVYETKYPGLFDILVNGIPARHVGCSTEEKNGRIIISPHMWFRSEDYPEPPKHEFYGPSIAKLLNLKDLT